MKTLLDLYRSHTGKVSDKWALYLREYDRLFAPYREQTISMLEIGIQNGGSLEIWSQYFPNAQKFVGCDINPDCAKLTYADARITVIVGDATTPETQAQVLAQSASFDLIIEDGSHTSSDIVKAFARYFPALKSGGLFVAEDLHCSYWQDYEGGIFHPYSSITFFKHLADMVNHEHWGVEKSRSELIVGFKQVLNVDFDETVLGQISSIEFLNSICVVRKKEGNDNVLGLRVVAGSDAEVMPVILSLANSSSAPVPQVENQWSILFRPPAESYQDQIHDINMGKELIAQQRADFEQLRNEVEAKQAAVEQLRNEVEAKQAAVEQLRNEVEAKQAEVEQLSSDVQAKHAEVAYLNHLVSAMQSSRSWRYTAALRKAGSLVRPVVRVLRRIKSSARLNGGYVGLGLKAFTLLRQEGWQGVLLRLSGAQPGAPVVTHEGQAVDRNDYQTWIKLYDSLDAQAIERIQAEIASFEKCPKISVVMPVYNAPLEFLKQAIESVQAQLYPHWELCIADDASTDAGIRPMLESFAKVDPRIKVVFRQQNGHISAASNSALELASGDFVALLDNDDLLPLHALYHVAKTILATPDAALIYSDEDKINPAGQRYDPYFKCELNYELLLAQNMICHLGVYRRTLLEGIGGFREGFEGAQDYDLTLRVLEKVLPEQVVHIPKVLYHWRAIPGSTALAADEKNYAAIAARKVIAEHLQRTGRGGTVTAAPGAPSLNRVRYALPAHLPLVSIIIPTRDHADILGICLASVLNKTSYPHFEIIVVDNGSVEQETQQLLASQPQDKVRVMRDDRPFNYSRLNNLAVQVAKGDVICLMNNDIEVLTPDWLEEMLSFALQSDIGCVGARLWYPSGVLQHGGVVLGIGGIAGHSHKYLSRQQSGYFGRAVLHQSFSAVTAACLVIRREIWEEVEGLDESFAVAFNDVDFCMRVRDGGYRNVWTPYAEMIHHESLSRGEEDNPEKIARFQSEIHRMDQRWGAALHKDPAYSPNLTHDHEDFSLRWD
jgi:glycosyltransferase involved in cell wall biosynthesis/cell division protein FtsB